MLDGEVREHGADGGPFKLGEPLVFRGDLRVILDKLAGEGVEGVEDRLVAPAHRHHRAHAQDVVAVGGEKFLVVLRATMIVVLGVQPPKVVVETRSIGDGHIADGDFDLARLEHDGAARLGTPVRRAEEDEPRDFRLVHDAFEPEGAGLDRSGVGDPAVPQIDVASFARLGQAGVDGAFNDIGVGLIVAGGQGYEAGNKG